MIRKTRRTMFEIRLKMKIKIILQWNVINGVGQSDLAKKGINMYPKNSQFTFINKWPHKSGLVDTPSLGILYGISLHCLVFHKITAFSS